jgi:MSHA pilin protein MshD
MKPASSPTSRPVSLRRQARGFTLIDVLVVITLVGLIAGSVMVWFMNMSKQSAEIMRTRQVISVAQALLDEIRMMPYTTCELKINGCSAAVEAMGPEANEVRYHTALNDNNTRFDNPNDYNGLTQPGPGCAGICDIKGTVLNPVGGALEGCTAAVAVAQQAMAAIPNTEAVLISVTVTCPGISPLTLQGVRTRYAPSTY